RHLGLNLRQGRVGVVVQVQVHEDRAQRLGAGRLHDVDAVRAGDDALERRRDEAADQVGVGADVGGRDADDGDVAARVLADAERADRLQAGDQDHQVDDDGEDGTFDEEICEAHGDTQLESVNVSTPNFQFPTPKALPTTNSQ